MPFTPTQHRAYAALADEWAYMRDVAAGEKAVKAKRTEYLPALDTQKGEHDPAYDRYLQRAVFYPATGNTIGGMSGIAMRKPADLYIPNVLDAWIEDVTTDHRSLMSYARFALRELLTVGFGAIVIDWSNTRSRPVWSHYNAEDVVDWRFVNEGGSVYLAALLLREVVQEPRGDMPFDTEDVRQYRLFERRPTGVVVTTFRESSRGKRWVEYTPPKAIVRSGEPLTQIPAVLFSVDGPMCDPTSPPLYGMARVNVSHYRTMADLEQARFWTASPTPWITGHTATDDVFPIGGAEAWVLSEADARVGLLEFTGTGLGELRQADADKRAMMTAIGARLLDVAPAANETAEAARARYASGHATLRDVVGELSNALTLALRWSYWWMSREKGIDTPAMLRYSVRLSTDFLPSRLTAQEITAIQGLWTGGAISDETMYYNLQAGEIARPGVTWDAEKQLIDAADGADLEDDPADPNANIDGTDNQDDNADDNTDDNTDGA